MDHPRRSPKRRRGWRRFRRVAAVVVLIAASVGAAAAYVALGDTERWRRTAESYLQRYTTGRVAVGSAEWSWQGGFRLADVRITAPRSRSVAPDRADVAHRQDPAFSCSAIDVRYDPWALLRGRLRIRSLIAHKPTCLIVRDVHGNTNLADLLQTTTGPARDGPIALPTVELRDARIKVVTGACESARVVEDLRLTVRGLASGPGSSAYDLVWNSGPGRTSNGRARLDLRTGRVRNVRGGLPWLSLEAILIAVNSEFQQAGDWSEVLGLEGSVRVSDYDLSLDPRAEGSRSATIQLRDAALSIPLDEREEPLEPHERYLRFDQVTGTIQVTTAGLRAKFDARFHGAPCSVEAELHGGAEAFASLDDIAFDVRITATGLELPRTGAAAPPEQLRFVEHWTPIAKFYGIYDPHGLVDLNIVADKQAGPDTPVRLKAMTLTARGCDALCRFFPYRVSDLSGSVEFTPDGVFLRGLEGAHGEGRVRVDGWLEAPKRWAAARIYATGQDIAIDDDLVAAVSDRYRTAADLFHPNGTLDVDLILTRPTGKGGQPAPWEPHCLLMFDNLDVCYAKLPYPLEHVAGRVVIDQEHVQIAGLQAVTDGVARIAIDGAVGLDAKGAYGLVLSILGLNIPFDPVLLSALPTRFRDAITAFHPTGRFDIETTVGPGPDGDAPRQISRVTLRDVTVTPDAFPVPIEKVSGNLRITSDSVEITQVSGGYGPEGTVRVDGTWSRHHATAGGEIEIRCRDLVLDDRLCDAAPAGLRRVLADWRILGAIDTDTTLRFNPTEPTAPPLIETVASLDGVSVQHAKFPRAFDDVRAEVTFDGRDVRATDIEARYGPARVVAAFETRRDGETENANITLSVTGLPLDASVRGILPERHQAVWDQRAPTGEVDLHLDRLAYRRAIPDGIRMWNVDGRVDLSGFAMQGAARLEEMNGSLTVSGRLVDRLGGTALHGKLVAKEAALFDWRVRDVDADWSLAQLADGTGRFVIEEAQARAFGGVLAGRYELAFGSGKSRYDLAASVHGLNVAELLSARRARMSVREESSDARGLVDAQLFVSGDPDDPLAKRGGGIAEIREGHLFRLPIMLAILNVINLSIPERDALHNVTAAFSILGNRLELRDLLLRGRALALSGSGAISLPDCGLNLNLVSVSPHRWLRDSKLAGFVEGVSRQLVELHITGPLAHPTVRAKPFRRLGRELDDLIKRKKKPALRAAES